MSVLIFIDTSKLLDLYEFASKEDRDQVLGYLGSHKDIIITGAQVEMEFKKSRKRKIHEAIEAFKQRFGTAKDAPPFIKGEDLYDKMETALGKFQKKKDSVIKKMENMLANPKEDDPIYTALEQLFRGTASLCLKKGSSQWDGICEKARKRYLLGCPPRKPGDTSCGDAVNWEWLLHCAKENTGANVVVVTHDRDFGIVGKEGHLNDWLLEEFHQTAGSDRNIFLTNSLLLAFKKAGEPVKDEQIEREVEIPAARLRLTTGEPMAAVWAQDRRRRFHATQVSAEQAIMGMLPMTRLATDEDSEED